MIIFKGDKWNKLLGQKVPDGAEYYSWGPSDWNEICEVLK
jgi:hypothetical protein